MRDTVLYMPMALGPGTLRSSDLVIKVIPWGRLVYASWSLKASLILFVSNWLFVIVEYEDGKIEQKVKQTGRREKEDIVTLTC
jgi:hypothetical protein